MGVPYCVPRENLIINGTPMELFKTKYTGVLTGKRTDGTITYHVSYRKDGKRIKKCIGTEWTPAKASKERNRLMSIVEPLSNPSISLTDAFLSYMDSISHKADTRNTLGRFNNHIKPLLGSKKLNKITPYDIQSMKNKLAVKVSPKSKRILSPKYVDDMINLVHTIYNHYNRFAAIPMVSPASTLKIDRFNPDNSRTRFLSKDEVAKLYWMIENRNSFTGSRNVKDRVTRDLTMFVKLSLTTGARLSSVLSIRVKDIDFSRGVIDIVNHKSGGRHYNGYFSDSLSVELKEWCSELSQDDYLIGRKPTALFRSTINRRLQVILNRCFNDGVTDRKERVVVHTLRHTFASLLAIGGTPLHYIQKLLDHSDISMTQVYAKLSDDSGRSDVVDLW